MKEYSGKPKHPKSWKDKAVKINNRFYGSTHQSPTKDRIVRAGKKKERREAKEELRDEQRSS